MKRTAIAYLFALGMVISAGMAQAGDLSGEFCMFDPTGAPVSDATWGTVCDEQVTGSIDDTTFAVASPQKFVGFNWNAHEGVILGEGIHTIDTIQGPAYTGIVVGAGQVGGHILFDWGFGPVPTSCGQTNCDIDVVIVWDVNCVITPTNEECTYTSTDVTASFPAGQPDTTPGLPMIDGGFAGFSANFNFVATFPLPGAPTFSPPADVVEEGVSTDKDGNPITATPATVSVHLGAVTEKDPADSTVEYSIDGKDIDDGTKIWIADNGTDNVIDFELTETVNTLSVDWRATNVGGQSTASQTVKITISDDAVPVITSVPAPVTATWPNTAEPIDVCFGAATATDAIEPDVLIEWAINVEADWQAADSTDNCSTNFILNENTVYWRATDVAGNSTTATQTVTLNLPDGIVGTECVIDLETAGARLADGRFIMRDVTGAGVGAVDETVTGDINTSLVCTDESCTEVGASLITDQTFFGFKWKATPIRLFGEGTWTFEACLADGSTDCVAPAPVSMTVGPDQLGAHMLFEWSVNQNIDVVLVWEVGCGQFMLTTTDPDGDGILGTPMEDGPFKGFNAAFDVSTLDGEPPIAVGGYQSIVPVFRNPVAGESPLPIATFDDSPVVAEDSEVARSCVGGCFDFTVEADGMIDGGGYQFAQVVIPLTEATPFYSVYRKYDPATGLWGPFVIDDRNNIETAPVDALTGSCPEPGDGAYDRPLTGILDDKLRADDECVQLTIEDNGPNDLDDTVNVIRDPGGVAEVPEPPLSDPDTSGDTIDIGGCSISGTPIAPHQRFDWWLLGGLLAWLGIFANNNRRRRLQ